MGSRMANRYAFNGPSDRCPPHPYRMPPRAVCGIETFFPNLFLYRLDQSRRMRLRYCLDSLNSANRFMSGFFVGAVVAAVVMLVLCNATQFFSSMASLHAVGQVIASVLVSAVVVTAGPLAYKTIWRERRDSFVLDEDLNATLRGRSFGVPAGVLIGILIQNFVVS